MTDKEFIQFSKSLPKEFSAKVITVDRFIEVFTFLKKEKHIRILRNLETQERIRMYEKAPWYMRLIGIQQIRMKNPFYNMLESQSDGLYVVTPGHILFKKNEKMKSYNRKGFCASVHNTLRKNNAVVIIELENNTKIFLCKSTKIS